MVGAAGRILRIYPTVEPVIFTEGDDYYSNSTNYTVLNALAGNDTVYNSASSVTINGDAGNDKIYSSGYYTSISGGAGNDSIFNYSSSYSGSRVTLDGGVGNDTIMGRFGDSSISGGEGNDLISLTGDVDRATINAGTGDDTIYNDGYIGMDGRQVFQYTKGDGNDVIYGITNADTISISGATYTRSTVGTNLVLDITGGGAMTLVGASSRTPTIIGTVEGGSKVGISIENSTSRRTLIGTAYDDTISNIYNSGGDFVSINAGAGNDIISNNYGYYITMNGGEGNDTITSFRGSRNSINGGEGNDVISLGSNHGSSTIKGGAGNDIIYGDSLNGNGILYQYAAGDGNDVIYNYTSIDTINITGGDFTTSTVGSNVIISITDSNASLAGAITLNGAAGRTININPVDSLIINNYGKNSVVSGTSGNDTVNNYAGGAKIYGGAGDDSIYSNVNDNYTVRSSYGYVTIDGGKGNDNIYSNDPYVSINGGAGNDTINSRVWDYVTVDGGDGADVITAGGYYNSINGGAGNDLISLNGSSSSYGITVKGGTGDDTIYGNSVASSSNGVVYQYNSGDGNDVIYNFNSAYDTLTVNGSTYTTIASGSDILVNVTGGGTITLVGANKTSGIKITNSTSYRTLVGTAYDDTISNIYNGGGDYVSINAGAGNDTIYNNWGYNITIDAGAGNDTINSSRGSRNSIDGGAGNDLIMISSSNGRNVIRGGEGNDTIYGGSNSYGNLYEYENGDGDDIIYGYHSNDSITISGGDYTTSTIGNDVIISITDSNSTVTTGTITLSGAKNKTLNIYPTVESESPDPAPTIPSDLSQQDVIRTFMGVLDTVSSDGVGRLNQAVSVASGGYFTNIQAAINQMVNDCQSANNANDFLLNYCGINLNNTDTGAISGYDAGGSTYQKTASGVVPETGSLSSFTGNSFTTNGLRVQLSSFSDSYYMTPSNLNFSSLNSTQQYIWQALYTWWTDGALDLITESYGDNYGFNTGSSATVNELYFGFENENSGTLAATYSWSSYPYQSTTQLAMTVNMNYYSNVINGNQDGRMSNRDDFYLDRVLAHEFTHAVMSANVDYFRTLPQFLKEGMAELTHGIDDERESTLRYLAGNSSMLRNSLSLTNTGTGMGYAYAGGYMFLRYLAKQSSENAVSNDNSLSELFTSNNSANDGIRNVTVKSGVLTVSKNFNEDMIDLSTYGTTVTKVNATAMTNGIMIVGNERANSIKGGAGADTVSGNTGNDSIFGGKGNDILYGDAGNDIIKGDAGNDTISGGAGKDTLYGGAGNDIFVYAADSDYIADYTAGQDKIKLVDADITSSSVKGSDVILNVGSTGSITVKGGKGKNITVIDSNDSESTRIYSTASVIGASADSTDTIPVGISVKGAVLTASSAFTGATIDLSDYASAVTKVNAAALTSGVNIIGDSANNSLKGGKGKDTLYGGAGNDTLIGGTGDDVFVYGGGKDVITDYSAGDKIQIESGTISNTSVSGSNVIFKIGSGTLTVKNGKNKNITVVDSEGNETTQKYPVLASSADLFEDDNYMTNDTKLEDITGITADKYSVTEIQTVSNDKFAQDEKNYITYSSNK